MQAATRLCQKAVLCPLDTRERCLRRRSTGVQTPGIRCQLPGNVANPSKDPSGGLQQTEQQKVPRGSALRGELSFWLVLSLAVHVKLKRRSLANASANQHISEDTNEHRYRSTPFQTHLVCTLISLFDLGAALSEVVESLYRAVVWRTMSSTMMMMLSSCNRL